MKASRSRRLLLAWLILSALLVVLSLGLGRNAIQDGIVEQVRQHLLLTLDEAYFSSADNEVNDTRALQNVGMRINTAMQDLLATSWYSTHRQCPVAVVRIDGVETGVPLPANLHLALPRNQIERDIGIALDCSPNWLMPVLASALLGLLFFLIQRLVPAPLSALHREWVTSLQEQGYDSEAAFSLVCGLPGDRLALNPVQRACFDRLHDPQLGNFPGALQVASRSDVAALDESGLGWFLLGMAADARGVDAALELARAPDRVVIDLDALSLRLRGIPVPMSGTPLFYYAWYALQRRAGEGWVTNPASNRPDSEKGAEIAGLMSAHGGHGRAINDLEQAGLKARTLDQNRNKIKDEIVAVLGEKLAKNYLFEVDRHADGIHMRYRLRLDSAAIEVISRESHYS